MCRPVRLLYPRPGSEKSSPATARPVLWQLAVAQFGWNSSAEMYVQTAGRSSVFPHAAPASAAATATTVGTRQRLEEGRMGRGGERRTCAPSSSPRPRARVTGAQHLHRRAKCGFSPDEILPRKRHTSTRAAAVTDEAMELGPAPRRFASDPFDDGTAFDSGEFQAVAADDAPQATASFGRVVARSAAMVGVLTDVARLAPSDVTLTLIGETGTGKDVLAHAIHDASPR